MRFVTPSPLASLIVATTVLASPACEAFTNPGSVAPVAPPSGGAVGGVTEDRQAIDAMSQYEAALKAAFEQASAAAVPSTTHQQEELAQQQQQQQQQQIAQVEEPPPASWTEARIEANTALLDQVQQQEQAIDQYEAALRAALGSSSPAVENSAAVVAAPPAIVFGQPTEPQQEQQPRPEPDLDGLSRDIASRIERAESANGGRPLDATARAEITGSVIVGSATTAAANDAGPPQPQHEHEPDWDGISRDITSRIEKAESKTGGPLDATAKAEIVGTVIAGAAAAAVNSPLLLGAALGYAGTHVLEGKRGEALAEATKASFRDALEFTQTRLAETEGDVSKASARIAEDLKTEAKRNVENLRSEALRSAKEVGRKARDQAHQVSQDLADAPSHLVKETKKMIVENEDARKMPERTFKAVRTFLGSEEVRRARERVVRSIKDGLESEELEAVRTRATRSLEEL